MSSGGELKPVSARQSSTNDIHVAERCIDGKIDSFCHTIGGGHPSPWLAIDYKTLVSVQRVEIFNRGDCCGGRTRNVEVRISNELPTSSSQMFSGGNLLGSFAGPAVDGQHIVISGEK